MLECSSGVLLDLLSPQPSAALDTGDLGNSAVLVSKPDASSGGGAAHNTPTKLNQASGDADGDWQVL